MLQRNGLILLAIAFVVVAFIALGDTSVFDQNGLALVRTGEQQTLMGPSWLGSMLRDITALGSNWVLVYFTAISTLALVLVKRFWHAMTLAVMVLGGLVLSLGSKFLFARPRPDLVESLTHVYTSSFPSGHATMSMVSFLGSALVFSHLTEQLSLKRLLMTMGLFSVLVIGLSRIALGVHWPTDVLGGWILGALWVGTVYHASRIKLGA